MTIDFRLRRVVLPLLCVLAACGGPDAASPDASAGAVQDERARKLLAVLPPADSTALPPAIDADLARTWGEDWRGHQGVDVSRPDLDGDGTRDYLLVAFCGSSGACMGLGYRGEADGSVRRVAECTTGEEGLVPLPTRTGGFTDLAIPAGRDTVVLRFDGRRYESPADPSRCEPVPEREATR